VITLDTYEKLTEAAEAKAIFGIFIKTALTHGRYISALKKILYLLLLARKTDIILLMMDYSSRF